MTIMLAEGLPAAEVLREEGFEVVSAPCADRASPRLRVGLVNLMPRKEATELAFARLLAGSGHRVELTPILPAGYQPRHAPAEHIARFYRRWPEVRDQGLDALIVT